MGPKHIFRKITLNVLNSLYGCLISVDYLVRHMTKSKTVRLVLRVCEGIRFRVLSSLGLDLIDNRRVELNGEYEATKTGVALNQKLPERVLLNCVNAGNKIIKNHELVRHKPPGKNQGLPFYSTSKMGTGCFQKGFAQHLYLAPNATENTEFPERFFALARSLLRPVLRVHHPNSHHYRTNRSNRLDPPRCLAGSQAMALKRGD